MSCWLGKVAAVSTAAGTTMLIISAAPSGAQTRLVTGQAGVLGEWEVNASVTEVTDAGGPAWRGPLSLTHTGLCSADGPEEKTGELRLRFSDPLGKVSATLLIEGTTCSFEGRLKEGFEGLMRCPDRRPVPMMISIE
jgi:hypothetical protein